MGKKTRHKKVTVSPNGDKIGKMMFITASKRVENSAMGHAKP